MNRRAYFSDENEEFRSPSEPDPGDQVRIRFRTAPGDADGVYLQGFGEDITMQKAELRHGFQYYTCEVTVPDETVRYCFKIRKGNETCFYNRLGVCEHPDDVYSFRVTPGFHTPDWAKGAVMYQIFVDRFYNGDPSNDVENHEYLYIGKPVRRITDWAAPTEPMDVGRFYGGDLQGVWDKLDYLQKLGVEVIYFSPLFVSPSNHKYDIQDYDHIDPHYGRIVRDEGNCLPEGAWNNTEASRYMIRTAAEENLEASNQFFAEFVREIHRRGMRVLIDGVFNHCGSFNKWLDREQIYQRLGGYQTGAYLDWNSPYRDFFDFKNGDWPCNGSYDGWWGYETLPKLNYEYSQRLLDYILKIAAKWVSEPYCVDGWRVDVAADIGHSPAYNHYFWKRFRQAVKQANPDAIILAEHYGDPYDWLQGDEWDTIMNYDAFMEPLTWFLTGMEKHSDEYREELWGDGEAFFRTMYHNMSRMQNGSIQVSMNELSNHDHSRFLTRTNRTVGRIATAGFEAAEKGIRKEVFREAVVVQMTWPGAPTIYYGDEAGMVGWTDPDNRRTYPWGHEDLELIEFHRYMIGLHKKIPALRKGSLKELAADRQLIAYGRFAGESRCVVVVNNSDRSRKVELPVWEIGIEDGDRLLRVMETTETGYNVGILEEEVRDGILALELKPCSSCVFVTKQDGEKNL